MFVQDQERDIETNLGRLKRLARGSSALGPWWTRLPMRRGRPTFWRSTRPLRLPVAGESGRGFGGGGCRRSGRRPTARQKWQSTSPTASTRPPKVSTRSCRSVENHTDRHILHGRYAQGDGRHLRHAGALCAVSASLLEIVEGVRTGQMEIRGEASSKRWGRSRSSTTSSANASNRCKVPCTSSTGAPGKRGRPDARQALGPRGTGVSHPAPGSSRCRATSWPASIPRTSRPPAVKPWSATACPSIELF